MKTVYQDLIAYEGGDYEAWLEKMQLIHIFKEIIKEFDKPTATSIIRYIAYAYSKDSELLFLNSDWKKTKERCGKEAKVPQNLWTRVVLLIPNDPEEDTGGPYDKVPDMIVRAATMYLSYQNDRHNRDLKSMQDLYEEFLDRAAKRPKTDDDYKIKMQCRKDANEIMEMIRDVEKRIGDENAPLKAAKEELRQRSKHSSFAIRPEMYADSKRKDEH